MSNSLRPLHIGKYFPPFHGGMETFLAELACAQAAGGLQPAILAHATGKGQKGHFDCGGKAPLPFPVWKAPRIGQLLYTPLSPAFPHWGREMIRHHRPDLLHLHLPNPSAFWMLGLPQARRLPWIVHWHADVLTDRAGWQIRAAYRAYRPFEQALLARAARILVTSPPYLEASQALAGWHHKTSVVPLGMNPPRLASRATGATWPADGLKILAVGRLSHYKGFEYLLRALRHDPGLQLVLAGGGALESRLHALRHRLGLESRVHLTGPLDEVALAGFLHACDCLALPSIDRAEAFGMVLLEAMAAGKPVVVSDVPGSGMGWVVAEGITGLKVPPADSRALARALGQLARNRHMRREMGARGRERFARLFHIDAISARITGIYREVLDLPPSASPCPAPSS